FDTIIVTDSLKALDVAIGLDTLTESRLVRSSFNPLTGDVWVRDRNTLFFSIFDEDPLVVPGSDADTTRELTFLFWVRARDDAFVPDPTPSFGVFNAIEARHERDLLVIDMAKLASNFNINGIWTPCERALAKLAPGAVKAKNMYADFYDSWLAGTVGPDNNYGFDTGTFDPCGADSGFVPPGSPCNDPLNGPTGSSPDYLLGAGLPIGNPFVPTLRDILKHKVILIVKEHVQSALPMKAGSFGETWLLEGVLAGVNFWVMSRAPFQRFPFNSVEPYCYGVANQEVPLVYAQVFGLQGGCYQSWYGMTVQRGIDQKVDSTLPDPVRNEDFIGAVPAERFASQFPELKVDCNNLRDNLRWASRDDCIFVLPDIQYPYIDTICALPEVGYAIPITPAGTEGMYLYKSRFGEAKYPFWDLAIDDYQGTVVAVRRDAGQFRAAHWQITPSALAHDSFKVAFHSMMDWLFAEPWGGPSITTGPGTARRATTEREYSPELARYAEILQQRRQERLQEILPPGQTTVKDQFEFEKSLKRWQRMNQAAQAAELNSGY
ncbi:MAG TPA: hypothetical protein VLB27_03305, partial [candidate division Zixibacteria bacterium]|nr:hypothetical protein [candidate division Zixibacteria bacterium]